MHVLWNILQSGLVFGIIDLFGFITSSLYCIFGERLSLRKMAFLGAFLQGLTVLGFGMLEYVENVVLFLSGSYLLRLVRKLVLHLESFMLIISDLPWRSLEGIFSALAESAYTALFINLYPDRIGQITSWSTTFIEVGYSVGPIIGRFFMTLVDFTYPS